MPVTIDFGGKTALITGAAKGIGAQCARMIAQAGARVAVNYRNSEEQANALVAELTGSGADAIAVRFDVSDRDAVARGVAEIEDSFEGIDLLVNNAGSRYDNLTHRMSMDDWNRSFGDNLVGCFNVTQACLEGMMRRKYGRIVSVSSIAGQIGSLGQCNYASAKAGVVAFMKSVAIEYASRNIRANCVVPGIIDTDMTRGLKGELVEHFLSRIPFKRFGEPEEVAGVVLFLLSDLSSYVTGAAISVNGGGLMV